MLPIERSQKILEWLECEGNLRISDLSKRLKVSEMTVYRDIKPLIEQQKVIKTSNGVALSPPIKKPAYACSYCYKESNTRHSVQIITIHQQVEQTCCLHCGLLYYSEIEDKVSQILCKDFLHDTTMSAKLATYIIGADINLNCCQPQVIAFESMKQAKQFQKGFGGEVYQFSNAIGAIKQIMNGSCPCTDKVKVDNNNE
ncbi:HTH-type transcriptional repressor YcnK [Heyndrickxia sporothermodurans]|nr:HTH-type transcriptional repressor YcnK [Heyndrickxia sporothermodurans]